MKQEGLVAVGGSVRLQLWSGIAGILLLVLFGQAAYAFAYGYGVLLMVVNGIWLAARLGKVRGLDVKSGQSSLFAGAAIRFVALIAGLFLAHFLGLHLLVVAAGMFVAQMALFVFALVDSGEAA